MQLNNSRTQRSDQGSEGYFTVLNSSAEKIDLPRSSPYLIPAFLPVGARSFGKTLHRTVHMLPGNVALTFANQIDDPLMSFDVFTPRRGLLITGRYAHANEGKK